MKIFGFNITRISKTQDSNKPKTTLLNKFISQGLMKIGSNSNCADINVEIRHKSKKQCISIGNESVVSGHFIIENEHGKISVGDRTFIGGGHFISINSISIGADVMFSWGCTIIDNDAHSLDWKERVTDVLDWKKGMDEKKLGAYKNWANVESAPIIVEDRSWIGFNVIILKGVTIGEGAVVAAGSVVTKDVAPYTLVAGNPARFIRELPR